MANHVATDYTIIKGTVEDVVAALETAIEAIATTQTLDLIDVVQLADKKYIGVIFHHTTP